MSERLGHSPEHHEQHVPTLERAPEKEVSVRAEQQRQQELGEKAQHVIEKEALSKTDLKISEEDSRKAHEAGFVGHEAKAHNLRINLRRARRHLNPADRLLSKALHTPAIDHASEFGSKTIARPLGLLTGGFFALVATSYFVYYTRQNGLRYNFSMFIVCFIGGYALGLILELIWRVVRRPT